MAEFTGTHVHSLDEKGRVSVPAQFRRQLTGEDLFLNLGMDGCLELYTPEKWDSIRESLGRLHRNQQRVRFFLRRFTSYLRPVSIDAQGRISIPADLTAMAGIRGEVVFLGQIDKIEIWAPDRYAASLKRDDVSFEEVAEGLEIDL
jgi:MraZ protein